MLSLVPLKSQCWDSEWEAARNEPREGSGGRRELLFLTAQSRVLVAEGPICEEMGCPGPFGMASWGER